MLLVSSNLPDYEVVLQAATSNVVVVAVQYDSWSIEDLKAAIIKRADEPDGDFSSIGIFDHGAPGEFCLLKSVKGGSIDLADTLSLSKENEVIAFFKWLATYLDKDEDPRIDLLGCSIAKGARGEGLIAHLEKEIGVNFAASTDDTGVGEGAEDGMDFVMETEGDEFDVVDLYFDEEDIRDWKHTARSAIVALRAVQATVALRAGLDPAKKPPTWGPPKKAFPKKKIWAIAALGKKPKKTKRTSKWDKMRAEVEEEAAQKKKLRGMPVDGGSCAVM